MATDTNENRGENHLIGYVYLLLRLGAVISVGLFALGTQAWLWENPWPGLFGFILWIAFPMIFFCGVTWAVNRYYGGQSISVALLVSSAILVLLGIRYYVTVLLLGADPGDEPNLVYIFVPMRQLLAGVVLGIVCLIFGIIQTRKRDNRSTSANPGMET